MRSDLSLSVAVVIAILCSNFTCHQAEIHRKVIRTGEESRACVMNQTLNLMNDIRSAAQQSSDGLSSGSWGSWGPWGECSRSCGGGVREQIRSCLPRSGSRPPVHPPQTGVRVQVPEPHRHTAAENTESNLSRRADQRPQGVSATGRRRANDGRISLRMYGYSRIPNRTPLRKDSDRTPHNRQRRSASSYPQQNHRPHHRNTHQIHRQNTLHKPHRRLTWAPVQQRNPAHNTQPHPITPDTPTSGPARPDGTLLNIFCPGSSAQHKLCNTKACPSSGRPIRDVQCSAFNTQPFMGKLYEWEPFHDVPADQRCELNCRAAGFRFYIRQSERVIDGTPCGQNETSVCVRGACQSAGCDDLLGSGKVQDKCGVCGGDNSGCKLISGLFQHSLSKVGYHKIIEIPEGATKINVTEMEKSRNYLALRSRSGRSIINGNWAIDRPGMYEGVGTMFTYRRPNEISSTAGESFLAEGPTNEILDVYMIYQQPNPGVHYEFIMPSDPRAAEQNQREAHVNRQTGSDPNGLNNQDPPPVPDNQLPAAPPPHRQREYNWKLTGTSDCSATCGRGSRYTVFSCVQRLTHTPVPNSLCDSSTKPSQQEEPCNTQPCPAFWDVGEWSECSKTCGLGLQHRQILCRQVYANRTLNVHTSRCQHLERPDTSATCQLKICSEWQIHSEWSPCSVPCGVGQRSREVYCVSNVGDIVADEECNMKLRPSDVENCDAGSCTRSWFFSAWGDQCSAECGVGVRTRSVLCMNNHISSLPLEGCGSERPSEVQPCNNGPCERRTEWFTGPWSQCSAACGSGSQQRAVVCLMRSGEDFTVLPPYECSSLDRPLSQQSCLIKACGAQWYHTDWSVCSKTCDRGYRVREVRCLSNDMITSDSCEERLKPDVKEECNPEPCLPLIDEKCRDKYFNCNVVVQARLCVYDYYKMACCASCTRVMQRNSERWRHR